LATAPPAYRTTLIFLAASHIELGEVAEAEATMARLRMLHNQFTVHGFLEAVFIAPDDKLADLRKTLSVEGVWSE